MPNSPSTVTLPMVQILSIHLPREVQTLRFQLCLVCLCSETWGWERFFIDMLHLPHPPIAPWAPQNPWFAAPLTISLALNCIVVLFFLIFYCKIKKKYLILHIMPSSQGSICGVRPALPGCILCLLYTCSCSLCIFLKWLSKQQWLLDCALRFTYPKGLCEVGEISLGRKQRGKNGLVVW